ncbi:immunoglobulin-like domain-containing protein [Flammeovirga sp. EKP202]|uniref:immunoglobulin-like domain-containing protein n=1 Tax=Flammeovirga sp. EKP202 TaxID=2770592 RepID=UPI00165EC806|nr:immunoglobulin-like domain-containing protein [Flammeovirga sp. EKP202]MBD0401452.1 T9SS type A sorting domain-containing protein [Flammeovirga sp. EKP202]
MKFKTTFLLASVLMICISSVYANITAPLLSLSSASNLVPNHQFKDGDGNPSLEEWSNTVATSPNSITAVAGTGDNHQILISKTDVSGNWNTLKMGLSWQDIDLSTQEGNAKFILSGKVKASNDDGVKFRFYFRYRTKDGDGQTVNNNVYSDVFELTSSEQEFIVPIEVPNDAFQWNLDIQFGGSKSGAVADIYFYEPSLTLDTDEEEKPQEPSDPDNLIPDDKFADALGTPTLAVWSNTVATAPNTIQAIEGTTNYNKVLINKVDAITGNWSTLVMALPWQNISLPQETENVAFELSAKVTASNDDGVKFRFNFRYRTPDGEGGFTNHDVNSNQFTLTSTEKTFLTSFEIPKDAYQWNVAVQFGGVDSGAPGEITFSHPLLKIVEASGPTDEELVASAKENLAITYATGEDATTVTQDITLPTVGENEVAVSWSSSNTDVISNAGVVTQQEADTDVVLTATLTKNDASDTKEFTVKVLAKEPTDEELVALAKENLMITYAAGEDETMVTQNLTLPTSAENDVVVNWSSSHSDVISDAGVVTQQQEDTDVVLTATLSKNAASATKEFTVKVIARAPTDEELVALAKENLSIIYTDDEGANTVTQNITLETTAENDVVVNWSSSNAGVVSNIGVVTRQIDDTDVVLTATLSKNAASVTKEFTITVLGEGTPPPTDEELVALAKENLEITYATGEDAMTVTQDIILPTSGENGVIVSWESSNSSVITASGEVTRLEVDSDVVMTATLTKNDASDTKEFNIKVLLEVREPTEEELLQEAVEALEIVFEEGDDADNVSQNITLPTGGLHNSVITWDASAHANISDNGEVTITDDAVSASVVATLTLGESSATKSFTLSTVPTPDEEIVEKVSDRLAIEFADGDNAMEVTQSMTLPTEDTEYQDIVIEWASSNDAVVTSTGIVTVPVEVTEVTLTATITLNDAVSTKDFVVTVLNDEEALLQEAFDALEIEFAEGDNAESVTTDIILATTGMYNTSVVWVSDRTTINSEGKVTRTFRDITTNLTATLQLGDFTLIKEFEVVVKAEEQVTSIDKDKAILSLYPNPTFGAVSVESSQPIQLIEVYNLIGINVKTVELSQHSMKTTLELDDLPKGQYILRVNNQPIKFIKK